MDFAVVVLRVHDNDKVRRDVDAPAEGARRHDHLNAACDKSNNK